MQIWLARMFCIQPNFNLYMGNMRRHISYFGFTEYIKLGQKSWYLIKFSHGFLSVWLKNISIDLRSSYADLRINLIPLRDPVVVTPCTNNFNWGIKLWCLNLKVTKFNIEITCFKINNINTKVPIQFPCKITLTVPIIIYNYRKIYRKIKGILLYQGWSKIFNFPEKKLYRGL